MKNIIKKNPPIILQKYIAEHPQSTWEEFRDQNDYYGHNLYNDIKISICEEQGWICCYCETKFSKDKLNDINIEHFIPKSKSTDDNLNIKWDNLLASCISTNDLQCYIKSNPTLLRNFISNNPKYLQAFLKSNYNCLQEFFKGDLNLLQDFLRDGLTFIKDFINNNSSYLQYFLEKNYRCLQEFFDCDQNLLKDFFKTERKSLLGYFKNNLSCNDSKGDKIGEIINPLELPAFPSVFKYNMATGELLQNDEFVNSNYKDKSPNELEIILKNTIKILNLNCDRLCRRRLTLSRSIERSKKIMRKYLNDNRNIGNVNTNFNPIHKLIQHYFHDTWPEFFTTIRWCLYPYVDEYLKSINYTGET